MKAPLCIALFATTACTVIPETDDADAGEPVFSATGTVSGAGGGGVLAMVWSVPSADPDYAYRFGKAEVFSSTAFAVSFFSAPPAEALNADGIGVGYVALFPLGTEVPEGKLPTSLQPFGFTTQHAVIYRKPEADSDRWWIGPFPEGYSCGSCKAPAAGQTLEGYGPAGCSALVLVTSPGDWCTWAQ